MRIQVQMVCIRIYVFRRPQETKSKNKSAAKFKKRAGARAVKTVERIAAGAGGVLNRRAATT